MRLTSNIWISGGYYLDFDQHGQFRIIGPNNQLYFGLVNFPQKQLQIKRVAASSGGFKLTVTGQITSPALLFIPAMGDMRTIREITRTQQGKVIDFAQLRRTHFTLHGEAMPMKIEVKDLSKSKRFRFRRFYGENWYGVDLYLKKPVMVREINKPMKGWHISSHKSKVKTQQLITFKITAETNDYANYTGACILPTTSFAKKTKKNRWKAFGRHASLVHQIWEQTREEINHLVCWGKTSGDRFGTVFPRDYLESVILGAGDLPQEAIDRMIERTLAHVNQQGIAWHEDVIGEYKFKHEVGGHDLFDRKMIDIEPLTFLALDHASEKLWQEKDNVAALSRMASFISKQAEKALITFKKRPPKESIPQTPEELCHGSFYAVGNWRDSAQAYKKIHPVVAPFDVNAVFYPEALKRIRKYRDKLGVYIDQKKFLRWQKMADNYSFNNTDGLPAYALALYDPHPLEACLEDSWQSFAANKEITASQMQVNHLDESYFYLFRETTEKRLLSFLTRLASEKYFYTPSGPVITARNNNFGYTENDYHGVVVWMKQTAFTVAALARWYRKGKKLGFEENTQKLLRQSIVRICQQTLFVIEKLAVIPELHIDKDGQPALFGGEMSVVQLWSAVGVRRVIREAENLLD